MNTTHQEKVSSRAPDVSPAVIRSEPAGEKLPTSMRAIVQSRYGGAEVLRLDTVEVPVPGNGQVLVKVEAAGVDRGVWHLMTGLPWLVRLFGFGFFRPKQPIPGMDVSGHVVAVGPKVTDFRPGDAVFGIGSGTYAEFALAETAKLVPRPASIAEDTAAVVPISGLTALQAVRDAGSVQAGQRVLIVGASGGVGSYAVQIARHFGARVSGVASTEKLDLVRALGAEQVIDYRREDAFDGRQRYDLIVDIGGRNSLARMRRALTDRGTLVIVGGEGGNRLTGGIGRQLWATVLSRFVRQRLTGLISTENAKDIATLAEFLGAGHLSPLIGNHFALEDVPRAIAELAAGRVHGKAVICIGKS